MSTHDCAKMISTTDSIICPVFQANKDDGLLNALFDHNSNSFLTYKDLEFRICDFSAALEKQRVQINDTVAILATNSTDYIATLFAIHRKGACALLLNLQLLPSDWEEQLIMANCSLVFGDENLLKRLSAKTATISFSTIDRDTRTQPEETPLISIKTKAIIVFTSSTTGHKKGVILSLENFLSNARESNKITGLSNTDTWLASLPLFHVGGLGIIYRTVLANACARITPNLSAETIYQAIKNRAATHFSLVPTILESTINLAEKRELQADNFFSETKAIILAGAPSSKKLLAQIIKHRIPVLSAWGMTETAAHCTCLRLDDPIEKITTVGKPFTHIRIKIIGENGLPVPQGEIGEIAVSETNVCLGYLGTTSDFPIKNGFFYTSDLGSIDSEDMLSICGRKDDMFISGGENIHKGEIEEASLLHKNVRSAAVIAIEHPKWGQRPILFIELKTEECSEKFRIEILEFLKLKLAKMKIPDEIKIIKEMPRTAIGKIDYKKLRLNYELDNKTKQPQSQG
jgi:o-succinylbenzoate---CoA ligase